MSFDLDGLDGLLPPPGAPKGRREAPKAEWDTEPSTQIAAVAAPIVVAAVVAAPAMPMVPRPAPIVEAPVMPPPSIAAPEPSSRPWIGMAALGLVGVLGLGAAGLWAASRGPSEPPVPAAPVAERVAAIATPVPEPIATAPAALPPPAVPAPTVEPVAPWTVSFVVRSTEPVATTVPAALRTCPSLRVVGHTCDLGEPASNEHIGLARAEAVRQLLVNAGVPAGVIHISSAGEAQPLDPSHTPAARAKNRRVEVSCTQEP